MLKPFCVEISSKIHIFTFSVQDLKSIRALTEIFWGGKYNSVDYLGDS